MDGVLSLHLMQLPNADQPLGQPPRCEQPSGSSIT